MTSFSSLLSSLGDKGQAPAPSPANLPRPTPSAQPERKPSGVTDRFKLTPDNAVAGVKRRSAEPEAAPRSKIVKTEQTGLPNRPAAPTGRFQLTAKPSAARPSSPAGKRPATAPSTSVNRARAVPKQPPRPGATNTPTPPSTADSAAKKKGFASILEKAKAAQAAAVANGAGGIKHKAVEKLTKRERLRMREEALVAQKAGKKAKVGDRSRSVTPSGVNGASGSKRAPAPETAYKGTMKNAAAEPLAWKDTMKAAGSVPKQPIQKGLSQDKYGGYASWSDLDDAEDEDEEEGYDESDDDMEGGFGDVEAEEQTALAAAKREDQMALVEEERLKREKMERKKKLLALSKSAAAKKKF